MSTRREFLEKMGMASAGIALGLSACKSKYEPPRVAPSDKINVGLVGCSQRGVDQVWPGMKHLPEYQMVAICDVIPERMDRAAAQMPVGVRKYRDYRELVTEPSIDLVIVSTPLKWHFAISKAAMLADKHVVCEKSMTYTTEEAIELAEIAKHHGKAFKVSYEIRNNPAYIAAKQLVDRGLLGEIMHADCTWNRSSSWRREIDDPERIVEFPTGERISRDRLLNWRMSMEFGGGLMGEVLCHQLDAAEWILGCGHVQSVSGAGNIGYWKDGRDSFDNVHATLTYEDGLIISCNSILSNSYEDYAISIYGRNATIRLGLSSGKIIPEKVKDESVKDEIDAMTGASYKLIKKSPDRILGVEETEGLYEYYGQYVDGYMLDTLVGYKSLAEAVHGGGPLPAMAESGKNNSIACQLANKAMHEGGVHTWQPEYGT